jgi:hypothetical protein
VSETAAETARRLSRTGPQLHHQLKRIIGRLLDRHAAAAKLFLDNDGAAKPAAVEWFRQLARDNYVNGGCWHENDREHAKREGRRELALEIIGSAKLDVDRLGALTKLEREME